MRIYVSHVLFKYYRLLQKQHCKNIDELVFFWYNDKILVILGEVNVDVWEVGVIILLDITQMYLSFS